jgi:hypothetical protein
MMKKKRSFISYRIFRRTMSLLWHYGTEVVLVREGPRAGEVSSLRKKGSYYFTSPVKTMTLGDIK